MPQCGNCYKQPQYGDMTSTNNSEGEMPQYGDMITEQLRR